MMSLHHVTNHALHRARCSARQGFSMAHLGTLTLRSYQSNATEDEGKSDNFALRRAEIWAEKRQNRARLGMTCTSDFVSSRRGRPELKALHDEIRLLGSQHQWQEALMVLDRSGEMDPWVRIAAISACGKSLQFEAARKIFQEMPEKNVASYGVMMSFLGLRNPRDAHALLEDMQQNKLEPDEGIYRALIESHGRAQNIGGAMEALESMIASGVQLTRATYQIALSACARTGDLQQAKGIVARMEADGIPPDAGHFTVLVAACARSKSADEARRIIETMKQRGMHPDVITYTGLLSSIGGPDALPVADAVWKEMEAVGINPDGFAYCAMLGAVTLAGAQERGLELIKEMEQLGFTKTREAQLRIRQFRSLSSSRAREVSTSPLPAGWQCKLDPSSGHFYYWQESDPAGTTTWERPSSN
eukprot:TRINITY_DN57249_c0_g1_i1.p1 TRINITY_DN57249_c0_g1~~TRINITY_DN57249_c0_g1_i1.p1  ORF type:complete len:418 (+),score=67.39 TRINITY_DN57249_c0_g1_i1:37-1290(+)